MMSISVHYLPLNISKDEWLRYYARGATHIHCSLSGKTIRISAHHFLSLQPQQESWTVQTRSQWFSILFPSKDWINARQNNCSRLWPTMGPPPTPLRSAYFVCTTPRTGSNLFAFLSQTRNRVLLSISIYLVMDRRKTSTIESQTIFQIRYRRWTPPDWNWFQIYSSNASSHHTQWHLWNESFRTSLHQYVWWDRYFVDTNDWSRSKLIHLVRENSSS